MGKKKYTVERKVEKSPLLPLGAGDVRYYDFSQNNSGGRWKVSEDYAENTIIAARCVREANDRAEELGIYFDGCTKELDCDCCGDRWCSQWTESEDVEPLIYGKQPKDYLIEDGFSLRSKVIVHHGDGRRETFTRVETK